MRFFIFYLLFANILAFTAMFADKRRAKKGGWRIPERMLMGEAILGGSVGIMAGMYLLRHKTRKPLFNIGVPFVMVLQFLAVIAFAQL